jgi:hypothetical protein
MMAADRRLIRGQWTMRPDATTFAGAERSRDAARKGTMQVENT